MDFHIFNSLSGFFSEKKLLVSFRLSLKVLQSVVVLQKIQIASYFIHFFNEPGVLYISCLPFLFSILTKTLKVHYQTIKVKNKELKNSDYVT